MDEPSQPLVSRRKFAVLVAGLLVLYYLATFVDVWVASRTDYDNQVVDPSNRAAIVLGAAQYNGEPSPVLQARLDEAATLYESGQVALVVVTGGRQPDDITTEAKTGYDYLRELTGIPDEQLRLEVQGASTYESMAATARFLRDDKVSEVVLVTDRFHAKRASLVAEEVGLVPELALTPQKASFGRLAREAGAVAVGRLITFRRLDQL